MKKILKASLLLLLIFHVDHLRAQRNVDAEKFAATITKEELQKHLSIIASDAYEGRETGMAGQKKAAQYLADYYTSLGLTPSVNGSWFQEYPLKKEHFVTSTAQLDNATFKYIDDFYAFSPDWTNLDASNTVFLGYGIEDKAYNDYKKTDVNGKVVMCLMGEPYSKGKSVITGTEAPSDWATDLSVKNVTAAKHGATGIIYVNMNYAQDMKRLRYWLEQSGMRLDRPSPPEEGEHFLPDVFISPDFANKILAKTRVEDAQKKMDKKKKTVTIPVAGKLQFHMELQAEKLQAENVLAYIEGSDPVLKNELVIISAHYDHIGITKGEINNGADDDGSGTVTTLELAQAFVEAKRAGKGSRRSILILNVSGEEKGLLGSEWYSDYPVFPLAKTVCDLNIDMIGRKDDAHPDGNYVYLIGSDKLSTDLHKISESANSTYTNLKLDYTYNDPHDPNRFYYRSDHYNFAKHNIPVIFYFSGVHEDYHKPGDDVEKIMFEKMTTIAKLVFYTAWDVANRDEKLKVDVQNNFEND